MSIKINAYKVLELAVDTGVESGWNMAHKYTASPEDEVIKNRIRDEIMNELCEWLTFDIDTEY